MDRGQTTLDGGGVWWARYGELWAEDGQIALQHAETREQAEQFLQRYADGEYYCAGCWDWHQQPAAFRRYAGLYCQAAGEAYIQTVEPPERPGFWHAIGTSGDSATAAPPEEQGK
jgi:hypothetical protein